MKAKRFLTSGTITAIFLVLMTGLAFAQAPDATPLSTAFTFQGQLLSSGTPYSGSCDFQFGLYDDATMGTTLGELTIPGIAVSEGIFTTQLDFGSDIFTGYNLWLEIWVRCPAGGGTYQQLLPRQPLTAAPYALYASDAGNATNALYAEAVPWSGIAGIPAGFADGVDNDTTYTAGTGLDLTGTTFSVDPSEVQSRVSDFCDDGSAIQSINTDGTVVCEPVGGTGWSLTGNAGTVPGTNFLGTTDNQALEIKVNGQRAMRIEPSIDSVNILGGSSTNFLSVDVIGSTIAGGGTTSIPNSVTGNYGVVSGGVGNEAGLSSVVGGGEFNTANTSYAVISGGYGNIASGAWSSIGGGKYNDAAGLYSVISGGGPSNPAMPTTNNHTTDNYCSIGGGGGNQAGDGDADPLSSSYATVSGGLDNTAGNDYSTISGGRENLASAYASTVGGGGSNISSGYASTVSGGEVNTASASFSLVGGGSSNTAMGDVSSVISGLFNTSSGLLATVLGGDSNTASGYASTVLGGFHSIASGDFSLAAGYTANAQHTGSFVWADAQTSTFSSLADNTFNIRALNGVFVQANSNLYPGAYIYNSAPSGTSVGDGTAILGETISDFGYGIAGWSYNAGVGVGAWSYDGNLIEAHANDFPYQNLRFYVDQAGNVHYDGSTMPYAEIPSPTGGKPSYVSLYGITAAEAWYEDLGSADLVNGKVTIVIDPLFAQTVSLTDEYQVQVTATCGEAALLFVSEKTDKSFTVQGVSLDGKPSNCGFDYRLSAKPVGYEGLRLETVDIPEPVIVDRELP